MTNLNDAINMLIKAIHESSQYKAYKEIKLKINEDEESRKLDEFRNQRFKLELKNLNGTIPSQEEFNSVQDAYSSLMMNSDISTFIQAEIELSKFIMEIYNNIGDSLDINLDFIS